MENTTKKKKEEDSKLKDKVLFVNRTAKVVKGGRRFGFSALVIVGDENGSVGCGFAKANELSDAIRKSEEMARHNMITFEQEDGTIPHEIFVKSDGVTLLLKPAPEGTGIVAGSKVRAILESAGVRNIIAKMYGSCNPVNQVYATFKALKMLRNRKETLQMRGVAC